MRFFEDLNEDLFIDILDELCYELKVCYDGKTEIMRNFEIVLKEYLDKNKLDLDQHNFVVLPEKANKD